MSSLFDFFKNIFSTPQSQQPAIQPIPQGTLAPQAAPQKPQNATPQPIQPAAIPQGNWFGGTVANIAPATPSTSIKTVYDGQGHPLQLGSQDEKGAGGEGTVYALPQNHCILVKIYKDPILNDPVKHRLLQDRIQDMVRIAGATKLTFLAWPRMAVYDAQRRLIGFAMNRCDGVPLSSIHSPAAIKKYFPGWDRSHLAKVALVFVPKPRLLQMYNIMITDFNPANILINKNGTVSFIDCDSYQIPSSKGGSHVVHTHFPATVAPELLKQPALLKQPRTTQQLAFSAAITVFHILMYGQHPYNFMGNHQNATCGSPEENLRNGLCPLGRGANCRLPHGPWYNLWSWLNFKLKDTFIQMFRDGHSDPSKRPSLEQLENTLGGLVFEMTREPKRRELVPATAKPSNDSAYKTSGAIPLPFCG